jgi:hypothetical protein
MRLRVAAFSAPFPVDTSLPSVGAAAVLLSLSLTGCSGIKKARECQELVTSINKGVVALEAVGKNKGGSDAAVVANLRKMADGYDKLAADTGAIVISTADLAAQANQYTGLAKGSAQAARDFANAIEAKDAAKAKAAEKTFDKLADEEGKLVDGMNKTCGG